MFWRSRFSRRACRSAGVSGSCRNEAAGDGGGTVGNPGAMGEAAIADWEGDAGGAWTVTRAGIACVTAGGSGDTSAKGDAGIKETGTSLTGTGAVPGTRPRGAVVLPGGATGAGRIGAPPAGRSPPAA